MGASTQSIQVVDTRGSWCLDGDATPGLGPARHACRPHTGECQTLGHRRLACDCNAANFSLDPSYGFQSAQDLQRATGKRLVVLRVVISHPDPSSPRTGQT